MKASKAQQGLAAPKTYPCLVSSDVRVGAGQHQKNNAVERFASGSKEVSFV